MNARQDDQAAGFWLVLARLGITVQASETKVAAALFGYCFLMGAFQFASKSIRQSTFVDSLGFQWLPAVYFLVAVFAYPILRGYSKATLRVAMDRVIVLSIGLVASSLLLFYWLMGFSSPWISFSFYIWISIVTVMLVSQFWTFANQVLDARQARRLFAFVLSGGLFGGILGGQLARIASESFDTRATLLSNIVLLAGMVALVPIMRSYLVERGEEDERKERQDPGGALHLILQSPHLKSIAGLMVVSILVAQIIDLQFNYVIENATDNLTGRTALFGNLYSLMGLSAFLFQLLVTSRVHRQLGIGTAMRVLPVTLGVGLLVTLFVSAALPAFLVATVAAVKIAENAVRYSLDQGTRELLFVPVPATIRSKVKAYIDVLVQRFSKSLSAVLLLTVTFGWITPIQAGWMALALVGLWIVQAGYANRHYIAAFRQGLLDREIDPEDTLDLSDTYTLEALMRSIGSTDSNQVLHAIEILDMQGRGQLVPPILLRHDDPKIRLATLRALHRAHRGDAVSLVQETLSDNDAEVRAEALRTLSLLSESGRPEIMLPRLKDPDPRLRSTAVVCLMQLDDPELRKEAESVLDDLRSDADPSARKAAARALGVVLGESTHYSLLQLLSDADVEVAREAIASVRLRADNKEDLRIFAPVLISLLHDRRLKHEAREALVSSGPGVIPLLNHFMNDVEENLWVRRALPKTLARFDDERARQSLTNSLATSDFYLKRKIIQALVSIRESRPDATWDAVAIEPHIVEQSRLYLNTLADLSTLSSHGELAIDGVLARWMSDQNPNLLQQLLIDRLTEHIDNLFALLSLVHPRRESSTAYEQLQSTDKRLRGNALEYLHNSLEGTIRHQVLAVADEVSTEQRLAEASRLFEIERTDRNSTLKRLIESAPHDDSVAMWIGIAAIEVIRRDRVEGLFPLVQDLTIDESRPLIQESALWVFRSMPVA